MSRERSSVAKVTYSVETELDPKIVWDGLTEFGPRRAQLWPDLSPSFEVLDRGAVKIDQRDASPLAEDGVVIQAALIATAAGLRGREVENPIAQRFRGRLDCPGGHHRPGASERTRIIARAIGVGLN